MVRMESHPILGPVIRGRRTQIVVEGEPVEAYAGEPLAVALAAAGHQGYFQTAKLGQLRGMYCAEGTCGDCRVHVNGLPNVRACITPVTDGMTVNFSHGLLKLTKEESE